MQLILTPTTQKTTPLGLIGGDGTIEDVAVTKTGPGAGEVNAQHTYSNTGNYTVEICVTDLYGGVGCDTLNVEVIPSNLIFSDGFESGDFSAWWWADVNGDLTVSAQAAAVGNYGMKALVNDTSQLLVYDNSPLDQKHYSARFYFHPNSIDIPNGRGVYLFSGADNTSWVFCVHLKHIGEYYLLSLCGENDSRTWLQNDPIYIDNAWTSVELEWKAASAAGANDGYLKMWINNVLVDSMQNLDNDSMFVNTVRMGVDSPPSGTTGTIYFDAFESRAGGHIGLDPNGPTLYTLPTPPDFIFADDFESNNLFAWYWAETNGGNLSTSTQAASVGNYGMRAVINGTTPMKVFDNTAHNEKHYSARFYFDPNSVNIPDGGGAYIFSGWDTHWGFCLYMQRQGNSYRLILCGMDDSDNWITGQPVSITDDWQAVEVEWRSASAPGANNGFMKLFVNGVLADDIENLDTDTRSITEVALGLEAIPNGASGALYFDEFESSRGSHIGLAPDGPAFSTSLVNETSVESSESSSMTNGSEDIVELAIPPSAAMPETAGMRALNINTTDLYVENFAPVTNIHSAARFYFDPNPQTTSEDGAHYILDGLRAPTDRAAYRIRVIRENGVYKLRAQILNDANTYLSSDTFTISNGWRSIEIKWQASTAPRARNGYLTLWVDGTLMGAIRNVDNDTHTIREVRFGAITGN